MCFREDGGSVVNTVKGILAIIPVCDTTASREIRVTARCRQASILICSRVRATLCSILRCAMERSFLFYHIKDELPSKHPVYELRLTSSRDDCRAEHLRTCSPRTAGISLWPPLESRSALNCAPSPSPSNSALLTKRGPKRSRLRASTIISARQPRRRGSQKIAVGIFVSYGTPSTRRQR